MNLRITLKKVTILALLFSAIAATSISWYVVRDGFKISNCSHLLHTRRNPNEDLKTVSIDTNVNNWFYQTYHYLGRGRQSYVFVSEDFRYVIKFPRLSRYRNPLWFSIIPGFQKYKNEISTQKNDRWRFAITSFESAASELLKETDLVSYHPQATTGLPTRFRIVDRIHRCYQLNLNHHFFIVQKRYDLMMNRYIDAYDKGAIDEAETILCAFIDTTSNLAKKGFINKDPTFMGNYGWDGHRVIPIDVGTFCPISNDDPFAYRNALVNKSAPLLEWLSKTHPEICKRVQTYLDKKIATDAN